MKGSDYRTSFIWFNNDAGGVTGIDPDEFIEAVNIWNRSARYYWSNFYEFLQLHLGVYVHAINYLWNVDNPCLIGIPTILEGAHKK